VPQADLQYVALTILRTQPIHLDSKAQGLHAAATAAAAAAAACCCCCMLLPTSAPWALRVARALAPSVRGVLGPPHARTHLPRYTQLLQRTGCQYIVGRS
jgi:hypothetical protein